MNKLYTISAIFTLLTCCTNFGMNFNVYLFNLNNNNLPPAPIKDNNKKTPPQGATNFKNYLYNLNNQNSDSSFAKKSSTGSTNTQNMTSDKKTI